MSINECVILALSGLVPDISVSENTAEEKGKKKPDTFLVIIPIYDKLYLHADNEPTMQGEEIELALYTKGNYLTLRDKMTKLLLKAGVTILQRRYVEYESDTGYHHYTFDLALAQSLEMEE